MSIQTENLIKTMTKKIELKTNIKQNNMYTIKYITARQKAVGYVIGKF